MGKFKLPIFLLILLGISVNNLKGQTTAYSNWYKVYNDTLQGINMEKALHFLQEKKLKPHRQIIVGIIDSGIDTTSIDLAPALWCNPKEKSMEKTMIKTDTRTICTDGTFSELKTGHST